MATPTCGYHFTAKAVSFGKGQSAVHTAAYNAREELRDERNGRNTRDYNGKGELLFSGIFAPKGAPEWVQDREQLWNRAEAAERQKNGQPARNIEFAFPEKLNQQQREWLLKDFLREQFVRKGMIADANIHAPHPGRDERNFHAHVLVTMRELDGDGFAKRKNREWNRRETLEGWRERWAEMGARALERAGYQIEADRWQHGHRTLPEQREAALKRCDLEYAEAINREATEHRGPHVDALERKGMDTERGNVYRDTADRNTTLADLKAELADIEKLIAAERDRAVSPAELIRAAYEHSDSASSFLAALRADHMDLALVSKDDAERSQLDSAAATSHGYWKPVFKEGEIVAVTDHGQVYRLTPRTTGEKDFKDIQQFMGGLEQATLPTLGEALEAVSQRREAALMERAPDQGADASREMGGKDTAVRELQTRAGALAGRGLDTLANAVSEAIEMLGDMVGATAMTPERIQASLDAREEAAEQRLKDWTRLRREDDEDRRSQDQRERKLEEERQQKLYEQARDEFQR